MVTRTRLTVTLHVHCLSCLMIRGSYNNVCPTIPIKIRIRNDARYIIWSPTCVSVTVLLPEQKKNTFQTKRVVNKHILCAKHFRNHYTRLQMVYCVTRYTDLPRRSVLSKYQKISPYRCTCNYICALPSTTFLAPIFTKLANPQQQYLHIPYIKFHQNRTINVERTKRNSIYTP